MKILFSHRYFWPDTPPYAAMLRSIAEHFADRGDEVHVFASRPSYRGSVAAPAQELVGGLRICRAWVFRENRGNPLVRALNVLLYCTGLFIHILRVRPHVVTASTFPPVIAGWTASLAARLVGARFVYHMQDVHPEVSRYSGGRLGRGVLYRLMTWLDNQTLRRASAVVVLSEDMANTLRARGREDLRLHVINNFLLDSFEDGTPPPKELRKSPGKRRVIFAGNLGRFQNLPHVAEGVSRCFETHPELELFFLGDGEALVELKDRWAGHNQVRFGPFLPFPQARALMAEADVGLVSLTPGMYRVSYPSKVLTYLGLGLPVLAALEPESALARNIREKGLGAVPETNSEESIAEALQALLERSDWRPRILQWYGHNATLSSALTHWRAIMIEP